MPTLLPLPTSEERSRLLTVDFIRRRALDRLYQRKAAVESLIQSLEDYQRAQDTLVAAPVEFTAARMCS